MSTPANIIKVAMPVPLNRLFDYRLPANAPMPAPGCRVSAPFGSRRMTGVVMETAEHSELPRAKLKPVQAVLDEEPVLASESLDLLRWAASYYHHPIGEVVAGALPTTLRGGKPASMSEITRWQISDVGKTLDPAELKRAPAQLHLLECLRDKGEPMDRDAMAAISPNWRNAVNALVEKGLVDMSTAPLEITASGTVATGPALNDEQRSAAAAVNSAERYRAFLLNGVTGSGKTEVYLGAINHCLRANKQVLMLVPEIGLTPQLVMRLQQRIDRPVLALHSGLTDSQRHNAWLQARDGDPLVLLGTRSAVFTPLPKLGLVIVDEEHDQSFKQQDGFRYHARDLAVMRANRKQVPIVLGSATPSLESMHNANNGTYEQIFLKQRAGGACLPRIGLINLGQHNIHDGLSPPMVDAIGERLQRGEQSLLFLNRRGYAPVIMCRDCGWIQHCPRCDAHMIMHRQKGLSRCHHCGSETRLPETCPSCAAENLKPVGEGTERVEQALAKRFPSANVVRVDRDTTSRKGALEERLASIREGEADIIIGTQMLSKGHDFPMITLVGVLNADQGLYGVDFRGPEHLIQQLMQVSGRAGRADRPGDVLIQTWHPDHNVFKSLMAHDYSSFVVRELEARSAAGFPPFASFALLRAEATAPGKALEFLEQCASTGNNTVIQYKGVRLYDAVSAPMEKRAGRYRAQLLITAETRGPLHKFLSTWLPVIERLPDARKVRWSVDVDPIDMY